MGARGSANSYIKNKEDANSASTENIATRNGVNETPSLAVVVAIDFGTCYSGYAFSFRGFRNVINTQTHGGRLPEDRIPTVILLNPDETFNSFGYDAIDTYSNLSVEERRDYFYFEHFKMSLYETLPSETRVYDLTLELRAIKELGLTYVMELGQIPVDKVPEYLRKNCDSLGENTTQSHSFRIKDILKKEIVAHKLFSLAIKYFRDLAVETVDLATQGLKEEFIQWIISIPAIWSDSAKQFMRQAAEGAGTCPENLRLVLEPEAASLYCEENAIVASGNTLDPLPVGHKYILADLGGGTGDICVHEVMGEGRLRELYKVTGGDFGGNTVNKEFEIFMSNIVGKEVWNELKTKHLSCYYEFMKYYETKKRYYMDTTKVIIRLEPSLISLSETHSKDTFTSKVSKCKHSTSVEYKKELRKLVIDRSAMERFFDYSLSGIIQTLNHILQSCKTDNITTLLLVGGYAESHYGKARIRAVYPNLSVMLPSSSRLAVLKGAVIIGYKPRDVVERRARFTYGFDCNDVFIQGEHPEKLRVFQDGAEMCTGLFVKMIEKNQVLKYGDTFTWEAHTIAKDPDRKHIKKHSRCFGLASQTPAIAWTRRAASFWVLRIRAVRRWEISL
ncbi:HS12A-like protein [Mya arenaria]|uniref:HS12A-like protein n=1 Tax=Mya arenaria TaxID=6604 RepID=A0ABY7ENT5_MYAAR|nr:HS12A-like protein [Mya arenaria]